MAYSAVPLTATGDWIDAAWINQYVRDNFAAGVPDVFTAAGEIPYATGANAAGVLSLVAGGVLYGGGSAPAWLAKPANLALLQNDNTGVPSWLMIGNPLEVLRVNSAGNALEFSGGLTTITHHNDSTGHSYGSSTWRDMPNSSKAVTVDVTSTIEVEGFILEYQTGTVLFEVKFNIDGTDIDASRSQRSYDSNQINTIPIIGYKTGVTAGSKTIKIRERDAWANGYNVTEIYYRIRITPE